MTALSAKIALLGSLGYFLGLWLLTAMDWHVSSATDWLFRLIVAFSVVLSVTVVRGTQNGYLTFKEGMRMGSVTTLLLALGMSLGLALYQSVVNPNYLNEYKTAYREMQVNKTMRTYVGEKYGTDTLPQEAIDKVNTAVDKYMTESVSHFFTPGGQVQINFVYVLIGGILTTLTVVLLARRVREDD